MALQATMPTAATSRGPTLSLDELIDRLATLNEDDLLRLKAAVDERLGRQRATMDEVLRQMEREGLITLPQPGTPYDPIKEPPIELEGELLSEQVLRERR